MKKFTSKQELAQMIGIDIRYYNTCCIQRKRGVLTQIEKHEMYLAA